MLVFVSYLCVCDLKVPTLDTLVRVAQQPALSLVQWNSLLLTPLDGFTLLMVSYSVLDE